MAKKPSKKRKSKGPSRDAFDAFQEHLERWKAITGTRAGIVSAMDASPALRILVENWAGLAHRIDLAKWPETGDAKTRVWAVHGLDMIDTAEQIGLEPHVVLRVFERARLLGVVYPDGTLHPTAERYLTERDAYAVVKPTRGE